MSHDDGVGEWISLPKLLKTKKALVNPKNTDNECFKWCVTLVCFPTDRHPERITEKLREQSNPFNWNGISFPVGCKDIDRFERNNDISVNVFGWLDEKVYIARKTRQKRNRHVSLFLLKSDEKETFLFGNKLEPFVENGTTKKKNKSLLR